MRLTTKGQVTIPQGIREQLGLLPWTEVEFYVGDDSVRIRKRRAVRGVGTRIGEAMRRAPKPKPGMTTAQLMALTRGE